MRAQPHRSAAVGFLLVSIAGCSANVVFVGEDAPTDLEQSDACKRYLACATAATPGELETLNDKYGPSGTCWGDTSSAWNTCDESCVEGLKNYHEAFPELPECGEIACTLADQPCQTSGECCYGVCNANGVCGCGGSGQSCNDDGDCCGGSCTTSGCVADCLQDLAPCVSNAECCSATCNQSDALCGCSFLDEVCFLDSDCCGPDAFCDVDGFCS